MWDLLIYIRKIPDIAIRCTSGGEKKKETFRDWSHFLCHHRKLHNKRIVSKQLLNKPCEQVLDKALHDLFSESQNSYARADSSCISTQNFR